jgi:hypothetical protein
MKITEWIESFGSPVDGGSRGLYVSSTLLPDYTTSQKTAICVVIAVRNLVSQIVNLSVNLLKPSGNFTYHQV